MNLLPDAINKTTARLGLDYYRLPLARASQNGDVTLGVPGYFQANFINCGFTAGLSVLHTFFPKRSVRRFRERCAPNLEDGVSIPRLIQALRVSGVAVSLRHDLNFREIAKCIDAGRPIITDAKGVFGPWGHWVVIYGYGRRPNTVFVLGRPPISSCRVDWIQFRKQWYTPGFGLVCWGRGVNPARTSRV